MGRACRVIGSVVRVHEMGYSSVVIAQLSTHSDAEGAPTRLASCTHAVASPRQGSRCTDLDTDISVANST